MFSPCSASARGRRSSWGRRCGGRRSCPAWPGRRRSSAPPPALWWEATPRPGRPPSICKERAQQTHITHHRKTRRGNIRSYLNIQLSFRYRDNYWCWNFEPQATQDSTSKGTLFQQGCPGTWKQKAVFNKMSTSNWYVFTHMSSVCSQINSRNVKAVWLYETENTVFNWDIISVTSGTNRKDVEVLRLNKKYYILIKSDLCSAWRCPI